MAKQYLDQAGLNILWNSINNNFQRLKYGAADDYEDDYVPNKGQVCLVITSEDEIEYKIGDGESSWSDLEFYNQGTSIIVSGYKASNNNFYYDNILTKPIEKKPHRLYIDILTQKVYIYESSQFVSISASVNNATSTAAGVMKLYDSTGSNTDGTMSQSAITTELNKKVEASYEDGILFLKY